MISIGLFLIHFFCSNRNRFVESLTTTPSHIQSSNYRLRHHVGGNNDLPESLPRTRPPRRPKKQRTNLKQSVNDKSSPGSKETNRSTSE